MCVTVNGDFALAELTLDCSRKYYTVALVDGSSRTALTGNAGSTFAFATDDGQPVECMRFEGAGSVTSILGRFGDWLDGLKVMLR